MSRAEAADELRDAGWTDLAADVADGHPVAALMRRLHDERRGDSSAAAIVLSIDED